MNSTETMALLAQSVKEVLETMFYIFAEPISAVEDLAEGRLMLDSIHCRLEFEGPGQGWIDIFLAQNLGPRLAANFLGQDEEEVSADIALDAAKELTNMIAGRFLVLLEPQKSFDLGLPRAETVGLVNVAPFLSEPNKNIVLQSEEGALAISLCLEGMT